MVVYIVRKAAPKTVGQPFLTFEITTLVTF